jgi:arylsulfatase A-like enzyme
MNRWISIVGFAVVFMTTATEAAKKPNVVFVLADQWRAQATGYAGDPNVKTPNIDKLESASVDFRYAISSLPVCTPCRASLLTGQRATTHGIFLNDAKLPNDATTLAKVMAGAGYDTGIIGKWHLSGGGRNSFIPKEDRQGFDYWKVGECIHDYNKSTYFADTLAQLTWDGYDAIAQTADAGKYIADHAKSEKPFLLCLWWGPPHNPYTTAPEQFKAMYDPAKIELRPNVPKAMQNQARKDLAGYYAHCSALDSCVGDLMQSLKDAGADENTIVIFSADHGDMLWSNGFNRKQKPWDESARVPMLWHVPGIESKKVDAVMATEDVMPTLLGLCSVEIPKTVEGIDYSAYMKGAENPNRENAALMSCVAPFAEWNRLVGGKEFRGIRTPRYTYVRDLKGPWLMYDDEKDPYQKHNLIGVADASDEQAKLDAVLDAKLQSAHDEFKPADFYLTKWGYKDRVNNLGTLPYSQ